MIAVGLLAAGVNTGNNLFYLLFSILFSSAVFGYIVAGWALRNARAELVIPERGAVGRPLRTTLRIENRGRWLELPALEWRLSASGGLGMSVRTPSVRPGCQVAVTSAIAPARRGRLGFGTAEAATDFPLGLIGRRVRVDLRQTETLVAPRPLPSGPTATRNHRGEVQDGRRMAGQGEEPLEARAYRPGDDARKIDWKATARLDRLVWRDRRGEAPGALLVRLDRAWPAGPGFEAAVSRAAGLVLQAVRRGQPVAFSSDEIALPPRSGPAQRRRIMDYLAVVQPANHAPGGHLRRESAGAHGR